MTVTTLEFTDFLLDFLLHYPRKICSLQHFAGKVFCSNEAHCVCNCVKQPVCFMVLDSLFVLDKNGESRKTIIQVSLSMLKTGIGKDYSW